MGRGKGTFEGGEGGVRLIVLELERGVVNLTLTSFIPLPLRRVQVKSFQWYNHSHKAEHEIANKGEPILRKVINWSGSEKKRFFTLAHFWKADSLGNLLRISKLKSLFFFFEQVTVRRPKESEKTIRSQWAANEQCQWEGYEWTQSNEYQEEIRKCEKQCVWCVCTVWANVPTSLPKQHHLEISTERAERKVFIEG